MKFVDIFKDKNDINEKSIVGFSSFIMMVVTLIIDIITGVLGKEMPIHEFIFDGFIIITLGAFGITSLDKFISSKKSNKTDEEL